MSYFQHLKLENYRNFNNFEISFVSGCNILIGKNGSGKSNILESLSLFEKGKGFRNDNIKNFINYISNRKYFKITSIFFDKKIEINLSLFNQINKNGSIKKLLINNSSSSDSIRYFSPSVRRNFLDRLIYTSDKNYKNLINNYKKNIFERQKILKNSSYDLDWIKNLEKKIADLGIQIYQKRFKHISIINSNIGDLDTYKNFSYKILLSISDDLVKNEKEDIINIYEPYLRKLEDSRGLDGIVGGCKIGPHKSDIVGYNIENNLNINQFSTGQQKTVILLIILAQCNFLIKEIKIKPIILFDEVCSHLDIDNRELLLHLIEILNVQTFITGTEKKFFSFLSTKATYYNINK